MICFIVSAFTYQFITSSLLCLSFQTKSYITFNSDTYSSYPIRPHQCPCPCAFQLSITLYDLVPFRTASVCHHKIFVQHILKKHLFSAIFLLSNHTISSAIFLLSFLLLFYYYFYYFYCFCYFYYFFFFSTISIISIFFYHFYYLCI